MRSKSASQGATAGGPSSRRRCAVVGAGFFGCEMAIHLRKRFPDVLLLEAADRPMTRASYANQARVHGGYHYPRSPLTGMRSQANYRPFLTAYADSIDDSFQKYYAISRLFSNVTANQFTAFCRAIGAPCRPAPAAVRRLFRGEMVEQVMEVQECAFNADTLREIQSGRLRRLDVDLRCRTRVLGIELGPDCLLLRCREKGEETEFLADHVFLCTYAQTNEILKASQLRPLPLRFEITEMALIDPPEALGGAGVTVMCGPFFSVMPHPAKQMHSLSHVRYTPHAEWTDEDLRDLRPGSDPGTAPRRSRFAVMRQDAARYLPCLDDCRYRASLWGTKVLLPRNDSDDGRPILFMRDCRLKGLHVVLGGKIDNVFDAVRELDKMLLEGCL